MFRDQLKEIRAANQDGASPPYAGIFVIYNFPERDCSAKASAGELWLDDDGLTRYKREYIDQIRAALLEYPDVRTIFVYGTCVPPFVLRAKRGLQDVGTPSSASQR